MKIAIAQMNVVSGQCEKNFIKMSEMVGYAKAEGADFIVFPEMCVSGYCIQDKWFDEEFTRTLLDYNLKILELSQGIGIVYGNIAIGSTRGSDGKCSRYNAAYFCKNNEWMLTESGLRYYCKHLLPNYRNFDDTRYFTSALDEDDVDRTCSPFIIQYKGEPLKIGVEICEDLWSENASFDATQHYVKQGVDLIFNVSASPWTLKKEQSRTRQIQRQVTMTGEIAPFVYVNACGMQNTGKTIAVFDGDSKVYDRHGCCVDGCNDAFQEECKVIDLEIHRPYEATTNKLLKALVCAVQEVDAQMFNGSVKWVIGLSGGLDSTINACLLTYALGHERVIGYNMASSYNSETTKNNAREMAKLLGIELREGSIEKVVHATLETMSSYQYDDADSGLVFENIQARVRGHLLSTFASLENGVVINNGNKIETALGYCTMYGDSIGAFSPLGDCTKVQLFELGLVLNEVFGKEVVPLNLLPRGLFEQIEWLMPPSAELKDAQLDPMKWFYHDWLISKLMEYPGWGVEEIMQSYLDGKFESSEIGMWITYYGLDDPASFLADLEWVLNTMEKAVFKRIQLPPSVMISRGSFGNDFRESQAKFQTSNRYVELRKSILEKGK